MKYETLRKLSETVKAKIGEIAASAEFKDFSDKVKAASDSGSFEVIISTADVDRQGESVNQSGWDLKNYLANPIVLWGHDYYSLPIGICDSIEVVNGNLVAKGRFAPEEANPFAQQVRRLYDLKIVRATSVGFIAKNMEGNVITEAELLEFSFVPVPANPAALSLSQAKKFSIDLEMLAIKGMNIEAKADPQNIGDPCVADDGTDGVMVDDGSGGMVCKPKAAKAAAAGDACTLDDQGTEGVLTEDPENAGQLVCVPKPSKAAEEIEQKGAVADELSSEEMYEQKCVKLDGIFDIIYAFVDVYMDEATPVDQFDTLLTEMIGLLQAPPADADPAAKSEIFKRSKLSPVLNMKLISRKLFSGNVKDVQQIGAILAQLSNVINSALVQASKLILDITQSEYAQSVAGKAELAELVKSNTSLSAIKTAIADVEQKLGVGEGEEQRDGAAPKERSIPAEQVAVKDLDEFLSAREVLREIVAASTKALTRINATEARKGKQK